MTVREFKDEFFTRFRALRNIHTMAQQREMFLRLKAFHEKLNDLGARRMKELPPEAVPDIDSTVELAEDEVAALRKEMEELLIVP
jgi:hypothetical protein